MFFFFFFLSASNYDFQRENEHEKLIYNISPEIDNTELHCSGVDTNPCEEQANQSASGNKTNGCVKSQIRAQENKTRKILATPCDYDEFNNKLTCFQN